MEFAAAQKLLSGFDSSAQPRVAADQDGITITTMQRQTISPPSSSALSPQPALFGILHSRKFVIYPVALPDTWYKHPACVFPADKIRTAPWHGSLELSSLGGGAGKI
jgi:hypothetical protein